MKMEFLINNFQIQLLNIQLLRMIGRESYFCLFSACCTPKKTESQLAPLSKQTLASRQKQEAKVSLRQIRSRPNQQTLSIFDHHSSLSKFEQRPNSNTLQNSKQINPARFNQPFIQVYSKTDNQNLRQKISLTKQKHKKQFNFSNLKQKMKQHRQIEGLELQKTAKLYSPKLMSSNRAIQIHSLGLEQTKFPVKKNVISNLLTSKNNLVSINNISSEIVPQKVEESMIMIDYFHPSSDKVEEIQTYLQNRNS